MASSSYSNIGLCGNASIQNVSTKNVSNGRIDIMEPPPDIRFSMWDKIPVNQVTTFRDAMTGNWIDNDVSNTFLVQKICKLFKIHFAQKYIGCQMVIIRLDNKIMTSLK